MTIANQTIPWMTALATSTGSTDGTHMIAALDQGGSPITYIFTQLFTFENIIGMIVIAVIYIGSCYVAIKCSKKRMAAVNEQEE